MYCIRNYWLAGHLIKGLARHFELRSDDEQWFFLLYTSTAVDCQVQNSPKPRLVPVQE